MMAIKLHGSGFTLIEVMVALSVLALGIAGAARLTHAGYEHVAATEEYREAAYLAHSHLNSLDAARVNSFELQRGKYNGRLRWELNFRQLDTAALPATTKRISTRVTVYRADLSVWSADGQRSLVFHSLLLSPPIDSSAGS